MREYLFLAKEWRVFSTYMTHRVSPGIFKTNLQDSQQSENEFETELWGILFIIERFGYLS